MMIITATLMDSVSGGIDLTIGTREALKKIWSGLSPFLTPFLQFRLFFPLSSICSAFRFPYLPLIFPHPRRGSSLPLHSVRGLGRSPSVESWSELQPKSIKYDIWLQQFSLFCFPENQLTKNSMEHEFGDPQLYSVALVCPIATQLAGLYLTLLPSSSHFIMFHRFCCAVYGDVVGS